MANPPTDLAVGADEPVRRGIPSRKWGPDRQPLYVIDGLSIVATPGRALDWLTRQDIETISVLKNAVETAMYGGRGANGVVLITKKRPRKPPLP